MPQERVQIHLPDWFDELAAFHHEKKGWLANVPVTLDGHRYLVTFYDPVRLSQDIEEELKQKPVFFEPNLIVVPTVTEEDMQKALEVIVSEGRAIHLVPEQGPTE